MMVMTGHILGMDGELTFEKTQGKDIFTAQEECINKMRSLWAMLGILQALPKTDLWVRLKKQKRLLHDPDGNNADGINFIPEMDKARLIKGYHDLLIRVYASKGYYRRAANLLDDYNPTVKAPITWKNLKELRVFVISWWKIGLSRDCFLYIKLLLRTIFRGEFKKIPLVVEIAIIRRHFYKVAQAMAKQ